MLSLMCSKCKEPLNEESVKTHKCKTEIKVLTKVSVRKIQCPICKTEVIVREPGVVQCGEHSFVVGRIQYQNLPVEA